MNCPVCRTNEIVSVELESSLRALRCEGCGGHWIGGAEYWSWLEKRADNLPERPPEVAATLSVADTTKAKLCPKCKSIMVKFRVGHETGFSIDQCGACKGIWFDRNELETLVQRNLHDDVNAIFTASWQAEAMNEERAKHLEDIYVQRFGAEDYREVKRVRAWLDGHKKRDELLAYLTDENPRSV